MREILFRGKRVDNGEWVEGQLLFFKSNSGKNFALIAESCEWDNASEWFNLCKRSRIIPETVGQFTGLTDKNGNKIFEDDILTIEGVNIYGAIKYREDKSAFFVETENGEDYFGENWDTDVVVIGNIHDNKELLEGV